MGIHNRTVKFLTFAKENGVRFQNTLTLGKQLLQSSPQYLATLLVSYLRLELSEIDKEKLAPGQPIDYVLELLGATVVDSMDYSNFENASLLHDLNTPIPKDLVCKYDVVIDSGTLEHIFNFPVAIHNCMEMAKTGGHFISVTPVNNAMGHGFFQFSPELYFRIFSEQYGFEIQKMFLCTRYDSLAPVWFEVSDPDKVRDRIVLENSLPTILYVIAKKINSINPLLTEFPQQSDYSHLWTLKDAGSDLESEYRDDSRYGDLIFKRISETRLPPTAKNIILKIYNRFIKRNRFSRELGNVNSKYFKRCIL